MRPPSVPAQVTSEVRLVIRVIAVLGTAVPLGGGICLGYGFLCAAIPLLLHSRGIIWEMLLAGPC